MKIVKISGGLGNQLFQYAFALALENREQNEVFIDSSVLLRGNQHNGFELGRLFNLSIHEAPTEMVAKLSIQPTNFVNRIRRKYLTKPSHFIDRRFCYQEDIFDLKGDRYLEGYWQSEKYFSNIEQRIRDEYSFIQPLSERNRDIINRLSEKSASVHVRRGDYLRSWDLDVCTPSYYERAFKKLKLLGISKFYVFSDDIQYCKKNIPVLAGEGISIDYVDWNKGADSWQDIALMSRCTAHIIANSSFSWWGAWLDPKPNKHVVAPSLWNNRELKRHNYYYHYSFQDIVPSLWDRVPC
jgi:hypothetical protein